MTKLIKTWQLIRLSSLSFIAKVCVIYELIEELFLDFKIRVCVWGIKKGERPYIKESEPRQICIRHENSVSPCSIESFDSWNLFFHFWNASSRNQHLGATSFSPSFLFIKNEIHCTFNKLTLIRYTVHFRRMGGTCQTYEIQPERLKDLQMWKCRTWKTFENKCLYCLQSD